MRFPNLVSPLFLVAFACAGEAPVPRVEWPLACRPFSPEADEIPACARRDAAGEILLRPGVVAELEGPHTMRVEGELLFALASGKIAPALPFDNGADYFVEGLARTVRDGKVGFVNEALELVIPRQWDFAFPFEDGRARVCSGCSVVREPGDEHGTLEGGAWGWIDREGRVVVPVEHERDNLPSPN